MTEPTILEAALRLTLASLFGAIIGWEREVSRKPAGLRTNMMVSLGAATFTLASISVTPEGMQAADPTRIVTGIATGIGFLGAGAILRADGTVHGMTTAAGIWVMGAVGVACGIGDYYVAGISTLAALIILFVLGRVEDRYAVKSKR